MIFNRHSCRCKKEITYSKLCFHKFCVMQFNDFTARLWLKLSIYTSLSKSKYIVDKNNYGYIADVVDKYLSGRRFLNLRH